jgi:hypothetical protein
MQISLHFSHAHPECHYMKQTYTNIGTIREIKLYLYLIKHAMKTYRRVKAYLTSALHEGWM